MTIACTLTKAAAAAAAAGLAVGLVAGPAGADVGAPAPEPRAGAKISLTNAVITGVVQAGGGTSISVQNLVADATDLLGKSDVVVRFGYDTGSNG